MDPSSQQQQQQATTSSTPAAASFLREFSFVQQGSGAGPSSNPAASQQPGAGRQPGNHHSHSHSHSHSQAQAPSRGPSPAPQQDISVLARTSIVVSKRQQGNPVLAHIRNVRWVFGDIVPDYLLGTSTCALFLSLRYHLLHPDYIFVRIRELQKSYRLRVLLCHVDLDDVIKPLHDITKTALLHDCTLLCAWSPEECGRYLETLKSYENKPASNIQERQENDYVSRVSGALTSIRHVNKTDSLTLCQTFGTLAAVLGAPMEELVRCPGIGDKKVRRLHDTFHEPFRRRVAKLPSKSAISNSTAVVAGTSNNNNINKSTISDSPAGTTTTNNNNNSSTVGVSCTNNNNNSNKNDASSTVVVPQRVSNGQHSDKKTAGERTSGASAARPAATSDDPAEGEEETAEDSGAQRRETPSVVLGKASLGKGSRGVKGPKGLASCSNSTTRKRRGEGSGLVEEEEEEEGQEEEGQSGAPEVTMSQLPDYGGSFMSSQPSSVLLRKRPREERRRSEATISPSLAEALGDIPPVLSP